MPKRKDAYTNTENIIRNLQQDRDELAGENKRLRTRIAEIDVDWNARWRKCGEAHAQELAGVEKHYMDLVADKDKHLACIIEERDTALRDAEFAGEEMDRLRALIERLSREATVICHNCGWCGVEALLVLGSSPEVPACPECQHTESLGSVSAMFEEHRRLKESLTVTMPTEDDRRIPSHCHPRRGYEGGGDGLDHQGCPRGTVSLQAGDLSGDLRAGLDHFREEDREVIDTNDMPKGTKLVTAHEYVDVAPRVDQQGYMTLYIPGRTGVHNLVTVAAHDDFVCYVYEEKGVERCFHTPVMYRQPVDGTLWGAWHSGMVKTYPKAVRFLKKG